MGMFAAVLGAMDLVSIVILLIMMLILGNTVAMGVRERTHEYGVLRAIGFLPRHLASFVLGEAAAIGALGGGLGLLLSYPVVEKGLGRFLEENMSGFFPVFRIDTSTTIQAFVFATLLGLIAAAIPAYRTSKLNVIDALRRVG
jgi:putative ABC transport system permease protein